MTTVYQTLSGIVREARLPQLIDAVFYNDWFFGANSLFPIVDSPGGTAINFEVRTSVSSNSSTYSYDDPDAESVVTTETQAFFNKDAYHGAARISRVYLDYHKNGGLEVMVDAVSDAVANEMKNVKDVATTTMLTDLIAQIDSSSAFSDASLSLSTYPKLKGAETAVSGALTIAALEDMIESLLARNTYGVDVMDRSELVILSAENQRTNYARLIGPAAYNATFNMTTANMDSTANVDGSLIHRAATFQGIPWISVPDFSTTDILVVHRPSVQVFRTREWEVVDKTQGERSDALYYAIYGSYNVVCLRPNNCGKLSAVTA